MTARRTPRRRHRKSCDITRFATVLWSDGSCLRNPDGPGGWAYVITHNGRQIAKDSAHLPRTTNNRAELVAVIHGLDALPDGSTVLVRSDSKITVNCATGKWRRKRNRDLWSKYDRAAARHTDVQWHHVRGHRGHAWNELADRLAGNAARSPEPKADDLSLFAEPIK